MKNYYMFAKLATEGDFFHLTASLENIPPDHYHLIGNQQAFSKEDAIFRFLSLHNFDRHQIKKVLKPPLPNSNPYSPAPTTININ